jgi:energy-coupling factor transporter transmembrane protein EcfT
MRPFSSFVSLFFFIVITLISALYLSSKQTTAMSVLRSVLRPLARQSLSMQTRLYATEAKSRVVDGFVGAVGNTPLVSWG